MPKAQNNFPWAKFDRWLQVSSENGEGADDSAESQQQVIPMLAFDNHLGDAYRRVQRIRAKRVTAWMDRRDTLPILLISSLLLSPLERLMPETQTYSRLMDLESWSSNIAYTRYRYTVTDTCRDYSGDSRYIFFILFKLYTPTPYYCLFFYIKPLNLNPWKETKTEKNSFPLPRVKTNFPRLKRSLPSLKQIQCWKEPKANGALRGLTFSAIVKVSGQNCFRALCGSLGQIQVELPKGFAEGSSKGSTKVPPKFYQNCRNFVVRCVGDIVWEQWWQLWVVVCLLRHANVFTRSSRV